MQGTQVNKPTQCPLTRLIMPHVATLGDGTVINVYTVPQTDWQGQAYGGKIFPDEAVIDQVATRVDEVVEAAIGWLTKPN